MKLATALTDCACPSFLRALESPENDVRIWLAALDSISPDELDQLAVLLDSSEQARAAQFRFAQDRHRFIATRGILRRLLGETLDFPASAIEFYQGRQGKPEIKTSSDEDQLRFNVSHASGIALFAIAWNRNLGVDLESAAGLTNSPDELPRTILSPRERAIWRGLPDAELRCRALLRAWTRKEAFVKATGRGLSEPLSAIEVALDAAAPQPSMAVSHDWMLYDLEAPPDFCAALVVEQTGRQS